MHHSACTALRKCGAEMGRFYWLLLFLASAIATHAAYVLYYPGYNFDNKVEAVLGGNSTNKMLLLEPAAELSATVKVHVNSQSQKPLQSAESQRLVSAMHI